MDLAALAPAEPAPRQATRADGTPTEDTGASALEPSPFAASRGNSAAAGTTEASPRPAPVRPREPDNALAAVAPPAAVEAPPALEPEVPSAEAQPPSPADVLIDTGRSPPGAPRVALSFLQWSPDPARRFAFVSIDGAPTQRVREGDTAGSLTVALITPNGIQFKQDGKLFTIRPRH
jgi:hypothetical protein